MRLVVRRLAGAAVAAACAHAVVVQRSMFGDDAAFSVADFLSVYGLRNLDPERAHVWAVKAAAWRLTPRQTQPDHPSLKTRVWNMDFDNVVGLAAGFDKDAEGIDGLLDMGFGFVEVGSITPLPQPGNPRPRVFRLLEDGAVINRYGFNSCGIGPAQQRLRARWVQFSTSGASQPPSSAATAGAGFAWPWSHPARRGVVGVNLGKNKTQDNAALDYCAGMRALAPYADYVVVNVSSPNTPGLRALQGRAALSRLLGEVKRTRDSLDFSSRPGASPPPLLVKIAPDLTDQDIDDIVAVVKEIGIDGIIVSNTTIARPASLQSEHREEGGGLSGRPLRDASTAVLAKVYAKTGGSVPLIGVGGVSCAADAYAKIRSGASLVQLYTAMAIEGPGVVHAIKRDLPQLLAADGFSSVSAAVGADVPINSK
ncbi:dihydroorotate dehydrogenase [Salpingoeca rosetta]|uniref:Dihydroorotate dehydrogenase (quinone), mitochondrial n=1 Tax=Salpingoeca rosetta (strain ATCC 50818 / BSB-021) TaxID=946362 RepID=F2UKL4_SALR5|nr:dihydroorotate dehydrogenase [Salpingoeca rosetta]EGD77663.1 dihydroorotate dehydrogenase [Salpingoeca rosetta]|eukprot:XP_004990139.1 dihydroorotate dehydrogenase [Salpingoeca rosetta]